eukprot:s246_g25.t4
MFWIAARTTPARQRAAPGQVWPLPLPYPEVHRSGGGKNEERDPTKLGLNFVVLCLNFLNDPYKHWKNSVPGLGTPLNQQQWKAVSRLRREVEVWNAEPAVTSEAMGRSAAKVEGVESLLSDLQEAVLEPDIALGKYGGGVSHGQRQTDWGFLGDPGSVVGKLSQSTTHLAKAVEPDRFQFWKTPSFDAVPFLDDVNREFFKFPISLAEAPDPELRPAPRVTVRCNRNSRVRLLEKLDESDRLALVPVDEVRWHYRNGMFSIPKDGKRDRMVLDARPPNVLEHTEDVWIASLGSTQQFAHYFLEEDEVARVFAEDLREFYHSFLISDERVKRNALAMEVEPREVAHLKCYDSAMSGHKLLVPCLKTMAMGDCNAVSFGQIAHLGVLLRTNKLELKDFVMLKARPPRGEWLAGLMIGDFILVEKLKGDALQSGDPSACESIIAAVRAKYEEVGLPRHEGKSVYKSPTASFWGMQLQGDEGKMRPNRTRSIPVAFILAKTVLTKVASVSLLEVLAGSLVSIFQSKRRMMSVLEQIYGAQRGRQRADIVSLSAQLVDEMMVAAALIPFAGFDFRLRPLGKVVCSDASTVAEAAVCAEISAAAVKELQKHALQKGLWNRLLRPVQAYMKEHGALDAEVELPCETYDMHPAWEELVSSLQFGKFGKVEFSKARTHINIKEVRAALAAEKKVGEEQPDSYYLHLKDIQVSLACLVKGRSSSAAINRELKQSLPDHLLSNVAPFYGYVRSKLNPSDDSTRGLPVRAPVREKAVWLKHLEDGRPELFDKAMESMGMARMQTCGLPDESALFEDPVVDTRTGLEVRREKRKRKDKGRRERGVQDRGESASIAEQVAAPPAPQQQTGKQTTNTSPETREQKALQKPFVGAKECWICFQVPEALRGLFAERGLAGFCALT